ncbi:MAG TPA: ubiquinol-cytochrome c reductase cytochrome b subunit [Trebonia sp.]|jgi:ubiquinol-cytochrome c reductase cytochrome b subunit|nr:ubiquinol-cytochrome c reductase cytochrome b subunit [Trebonia sp.]
MSQDVIPRRSDDTVRIPSRLRGAGGWLDDRFHGARGVRVLMRKVFPDHWSFMLGEIALWSFVILLLTGTWLALFFVPSMGDVVYHGSYAKLDGITMSQAYESTLRISFDIRGGLLIRQIHHWAADLFMVAITAHMLRVFFTGAYRKPREVNWLIGIVLFTLGMLEGLFGYSLPDDQLSGAGLRIFEGVLQGIPIVGTYLAFFLFGGPYPGTSIVPRMYIIHVLLIPGLILALVTAHLFIMFHQKHTQMPGKGNTEKNVTGQPFWPYFLLKGQAWFFFIFGALVVLATFAQINPIWLYGPYTPLAISSASQPDWYMGLLEGALRIMPAWEINFLGHTLSLSVLIPFAVPLGIIFTGAALWPFFEQWATGDKSEHHINDRPRNAPVRTGTGVAAICFYGILWAEGANDVIAYNFQIPLYTITWIARIAIIVVPIGAYFVTKRICLGLQRRDAELLTHGVEIGIIRQLPSGEFIEESRPLTDEERGVVDSKKVPAALPAPNQPDENGVPAPGSRGVKGWARGVANRAFTETVVPEAHGNGHGNGHAVEGGEHAAVGGGAGAARVESGPREEH